MTTPVPEKLTPDMFPTEYRYRMLLAYPNIAKLSAFERYMAGPAERDEAFQRILDARNLRRTHEMYLQEHGLLLP